MADSSTQREDSPKYSCILVDPPWPQRLTGKRKRAKGGVAQNLPYATATVPDIMNMAVGPLAAPGCHLWLWTTNQFLRQGFEVMEAWGFKYLAPIHWLKPTGVGNWFVHRSQTLLFGYNDRCVFPADRYKPNIIETRNVLKHSQKPDESYRYIEGISPGPRLELFARRSIPGWDVWGDEAVGGVDLPLSL